jgi:thiol:disulfide interchange protein DsbD
MRSSITRAASLALAYVLGMALTYAAAGGRRPVGRDAVGCVSKPWVIGTFAAIFVGLALSMFGFYELQLPTFLQSKLAAEANRLHGGHFTSVVHHGRGVR